MALWKMGTNSGITNVSKVISVCGWGHSYSMSFTVADANVSDFTIYILAENSSGYANGTLNFCCIYY